MTKAAGQSPQSQGWPTPNRLSKLRAWVPRIIESIENEREKMVKELVLQRAKDEKNALKAKDQWHKRMLKSGYLEKAVKVHATLAGESANQGVVEEMPPLDIEFLRRIQDAS